MDEQPRLEALRLEDGAAIAEAKVNAIDDELGLDTPDDSPHLNLPRENPNERVQQYIETLCPEPVNVGAHNDPLSANGGPSKQVVTQPSTNCVTVPLSPSAGAFLPKSKPDPTPTTDQSAMKSYIEFMARRELIANKIEKFDNSPENFHTWKISFKNMTKNISITPSEELSFLIEYTTNNSKRLIQQLRNAYNENPGKGTGERYGSNVVVTKAHLDKLENFSKISYRDNKKLLELGDLLLELQCAKEDGGLQGLKVPDEPIYIKPVLTKLPTDIQTRWQRHAFRYTRDKGVHYPPFSEFSKIIQDVSLEWNEPNLAIDHPGKYSPPPLRPRNKQHTETYK